MTKEEIQEIVFGLWDGDISVTGMVFALSHQKSSVILIAGVGAAIAATLSMGTGEYESLKGQPRAVHGALIMGAATLVGTLMPVLPFALFGKSVAIFVGLFLSYLLAGVVAWLRHEGMVSSLRTYATFTVVVLLTILVAVVAPGSG